MAEQTNPAAAGFPSDLLIDLRPEATGEGLRERLEHGLRSAIQERRLGAGTPLPPSRVLAAELGVSRSVVVAAYANLSADGYLEARQGAGTRVRPDAHQATARPTRGRPPRPGGLLRPAPARRRLSARPPIRLLGGLPDPALFPRAQMGAPLPRRADGAARR